MTEELRKIAEQHVPIRGKHKSKERNRLESALQEATELIVRRVCEAIIQTSELVGESITAQQLTRVLLREFGVE